MLKICFFTFMLIFSEMAVAAPSCKEAKVAFIGQASVASIGGGKTSIRNEYVEVPENWKSNLPNYRRFYISYDAAKFPDTTKSRFQSEFLRESRVLFSRMSPVVERVKNSRYEVKDLDFYYDVLGGLKDGNGQVKMSFLYDGKTVCERVIQVQN